MGLTEQDRELIQAAIEGRPAVSEEDALRILQADILHVLGQPSDEIEGKFLAYRTRRGLLPESYRKQIEENHKYVQEYARNLCSS